MNCGPGSVRAIGGYLGAGCRPRWWGARSRRSTGTPAVAASASARPVALVRHSAGRRSRSLPGGGAVQTARADRRLARRSRTPATPRRRGERRRARDDGLPRRVPDQGVWITVSQAADLLEVSPATVVHLARNASCPALLHSGRWWVDRKAVAVIAEDRRRWVSLVQAGRLARCSANTVGYAARRGWIGQREITYRALPSWNAHRCWSSPRVWQPERGPGQGIGRRWPQARSALLWAAMFGSIPGQRRWSSGSA